MGVRCHRICCDELVSVYEDSAVPDFIPLHAGGSKRMQNPAWVCTRREQ